MQIIDNYNDDENVITKKSFTLFSHRTSVSMEKVFWDELTKICINKNLKEIEILKKLDERRTNNLSSALRVWILKNKI